MSADAAVANNVTSAQQAARRGVRTIMVSSELLFYCFWLASRLRECIAG